MKNKSSEFEGLHGFGPTNFYSGQYKAVGGAYNGALFTIAGDKRGKYPILNVNSVSETVVHDLHDVTSLSDPKLKTFRSKAKVQEYMHQRLGADKVIPVHIKPKDWPTGREKIKKALETADPFGGDI